MKVSTILKWVSGGLEALLGIPVLGGAIVLSMAWTPLIIMAILHIVTIVFATREGQAKAGNILGLITSLIGWIPFVGMVMHIISAVLIMVDAYKSNQTVQSLS
jgi:hypothetical protein